MICEGTGGVAEGQYHCRTATTSTSCATTTTAERGIPPNHFGFQVGFVHNRGVILVNKCFQSFLDTGPNFWKFGLGSEVENICHVNIFWLQVVVVMF